jgi:murein DD-endopeptidase MepM/ murein hydrolase activator NlpD
MNIILVPGRACSGQNACLTHRHLWVIGLVGLVLLPAFLGVLSYRLLALYDRHGGDAAQWAAADRALSAQRHAIHEARREAATHLNALALKLGQLQAQVLRLNALGERLTRMAGIDAREFNFQSLVAQGGPESTAQGQALDVTASLARLGTEVDRQHERLKALESLLLDRKLKAQVTPAGWPVDGGWVSSGFGLRADPFTGRSSRHDGVDIASRLGSAIQAMGDGVVSHAGEKTGYGLMVEITHASSLITRYAHTQTVLVRVGDKVTRGQRIALVGISGRSTGPHLHFEVVQNGHAVNPGRYLQSNR